MNAEEFVEHFDHHSPEFSADPYGIYTALRARPPVHTEAEGGFWVLSRYRDIVEVATDDQTFLSSPGITIPPVPFRNIPIDTDPPEFFDFRKYLNPFFSPAASRSFEPYLREVTQRLIEGFTEQGRCDLLQDFAKPLPSMLTIRLLGLPEESWLKYSDAMAPHDDTPREELVSNGVAVIADIDRELAERRERPRDDMMSELANGKLANGRPLSLEEARAIVHLIFAGGLGTTTAALGNAFVYLGENPEARRDLIEHPEIMPSAIEEFLRYDAPVVGLARTLSRDAEVGGQKLREGERVFLLWASGNRDEDEFDRADEMIFRRHPNRHLSFGVGNHRCLGSNLARLQIRIGLEAILAHMPDYQLERWARRKDTGTVFECTRVDVSFDPRQRTH